MLFVIVGVLLIALKLGAVGPFAELSWWWVLSPFAGAAAWWSFSDASGLTKKHEMDKMELRKAERRKKNMVNLGLEDGKGRRRR